MSDQKHMLAVIKDYVLAERKKDGIEKVDRERKPEQSGEAFGEIAMLIDVQLLTTEFGYGGWKELEHDAVLKETYELVQRRLSAVR